MRSRGALGGTVRLALVDELGTRELRLLHNAFTDAYGDLLGKAAANTLAGATLPLTHISLGYAGVTLDLCEAIGGTVAAKSATCTATATGAAELLALQPSDPAVAPAYVNAATGSFSGTSDLITVPAWAAGTYVLFAMIGVGAYTQHATQNPTIVGFTLIRNVGKTWIYGAPIGSLGANWVQIWTGSMAFSWAFVGYSGCHASTPVLTENGQTTASSTTHATPALSGICSNAMLVGFFAEDTTTQGSWTPPTGMTERADVNTASRPPLEAAEVAYGTGAWTGTPTVDTTNFRQGAASFSVAPTANTSKVLTSPQWTPAKDLSAQAFIEGLYRIDLRARLDRTTEALRLQSSSGNYYSITWQQLEDWYGQVLPDGAWVRIAVPLAAFTASGSPSWASITRMLLSATANGVGTLNAWFDGIVAVPSSTSATPAATSVPNEFLKSAIDTLSEPSTGLARSALTLGAPVAVGTLRAIGLWTNGGNTLAAIAAIDPPLEKTSLKQLAIEWDVSVEGS